MMKKELSALFLSPERFQAALQELAATPDWTTVRLFHAEPHHLVALLQALAATTVQHLDIHEVEAGPASEALHAFLFSPSHACSPRVLSIHTLKGIKAASALGQGLASPACQVEELNLLGGLQDAELAALLQPLASKVLDASPPKVARLNLVRCTFGPATAACLPALHHLTSLRLTDCVLSDGMAGQVLQPCSSTPTTNAYASLTCLHVCGSNLSTQAAAAISTLLSMPSCQLTELVLNNSAALDKAVPQLAAGLAGNTSLQRLELDYCNISCPSAAALAEALAGHTSLQHLSLNYNQIGSTGLHALLQAISVPAADAMSKVSVLEVLKAEGNWIKGADMPAWPEGWCLAAPLQRLLLGKNHLSDVGAQLLEVVLSKTSSLTHLDLTSNGIGSTGAASLVALLQAHPGLQDLRLDHNRLHDAGAELLVTAAQQHPSLHVFRADACRVVDMQLKTRISHVTQQLAARHSTQLSAGAAGMDTAGGDDHDGLAPLPKIGKRFAPEVYRVQQGDQDTVMQDSSAAEEQAPAGRRVRQGSRFPPEVYAVMLADDGPTGGSCGAGGGGGGGSSVCGGKHVLGAGEREADPRAGKMQEGSGGMHPFRDAAWRDELSNHMTAGGPMTSSTAQEISRCSGDVRMMGGGRGNARYSLDVPSGYGMQACDLSTSSSATLSISPPHQHMMRGTMSLDLDAGSSRGTESRSAPGGLPHQQITSYMTVRPSMQKKRSYKPLTPQQQAMFDVF